MATIRMRNVKVVLEAGAFYEKSVSKVVGGAVRRTPMDAPRAAQEPPRRVALDGVDLEVRNGETMGILGPSGCGKTTLLRAVAGLVPLAEGVITYNDRDMANVPPGERGIGIVFQSYALYPQMTSQENVGFFFRLRRRQEEIPERVREVAQVMGIGFEKLLSRRPWQLSGGERQRVAVARCIARDPQLFLFDEPFSNLDAKLRVQTRAELKRLIQRYKVTGIYVTHDQSEALALCDRIAIMQDGRIEQVGTAQFISSHPASVFVARFFGQPPMNLCDGRIVEDHWHGDDFTLPLPGYGDGRHVTVGVPMQAFRIDEMGTIRGEVVLIEPQPVQRANLLYIETRHARLAVQAPQALGTRVGDIISLSVDPARLHCFDTRTGRRL